MKALFVATTLAALWVTGTTGAAARSPRGTRWAGLLRAASQAAGGRASMAILTLRSLRRSRDTPALATASALCRLMGGDPKGAARDFDRALALGGSYVDGHYWAATAALMSGNQHKARQALRRALTLGGDRPRYLMLQVLLEKRAGRPAVALAALRKLASKRCELLDPTLYPDPMVGMAEAIGHALRRYPRRASVLFTMGNLMMQTRRFRRAEGFFLKAQKLLRQSAGLLLRRARLALVDGNLPAALRLLDRGLALVPGAADLRSARAEVLMGLGHPTRARAELERALKANPRNSLDLSRLADLLWDSGGYGRAERLYRYALRRDRGLASARFGLARALDRRGRHKEALRSYRAATALSPGNQRYHLALAIFLDKLGRRAESARARTRARAAERLARTMLRLDRRASAVAAVARQACRVADAGAVTAARLMLARIRGAPAVRGFASAHLALIQSGSDHQGLASALAGIKPSRWLKARGDLPSVLTVKGKIAPQVPVVLKRYLTHINPAMVR